MLKEHKHLIENIMQKYLMKSYVHTTYASYCLTPHDMNLVSYHNCSTILKFVPKWFIYMYVYRYNM